AVARTPITVTMITQRCMRHLLREDRNGWEYSKFAIAQLATCTKTAPSCTRAGKHATRTAGLLTLAPDVTSQRQACHGHVTTVPSRSPSPSGPPRWLHVLSVA